MSERILITGGSGFIGSEIVKRAEAGGHDVLILDIKPPRSSQSNVKWIDVDVRDSEAVRKAVVEFRPERIIHLASDTDVSINKIEEFRTTIEGTRNVVNATKYLSHLRAFVHTSTQFVVRPGVSPTSERHLDPYTVYGEAKAEAEKIVWASQIAAPWLIVRPTIIWGPHHPSFRSQIFKYIGNRRYLHPVGREKIIRTFGYVVNTAQQLHDLSFRIDEVGVKKVFYLGDDSIEYDIWADAFSFNLTGRPARRIPLGLLRLLGFGGDIVKRMGIPAPIDSGRVFRMSTSSKVDLTPTLDIVGIPSVSFERGVSETIAWLKAD